MAAPALIIISSQLLDRRKQVLNLPQEFPFNIDGLVSAMDAEIIWDKHETMLFIRDYSVIPLAFDNWMRQDMHRYFIYWDISEGHLRGASNVTQIVRRLVPPYGHPARHGFTPLLKPEVFAAYLLSAEYRLRMPFKQFLDSYTPPSPIQFEIM